MLKHSEITKARLVRFQREAAVAWGAFITGSTLAVGGIIAEQLYVHQHGGQPFFLNDVQMVFYASLISIAVYVATSLLTCKEEFNLERMLHRESTPRLPNWWARRQFLMHNLDEAAVEVPSEERYRRDEVPR